MVAGAVPGFLDPGQQEDLVVHGQAEDDGEHDHRHVRLDGHVLADAEQAAAPAELEDGDDDAVGGADAEQVEDGGLDGERQAAEGGHDEEEGDRDHNGDDDRQAAGDDLVELRLGGLQAGDVPLVAGALQRVRQGRADQGVVQGGGGLVLRAGGRDDGAGQQGAVRRGGKRRGFGRSAGCCQVGLQVRGEAGVGGGAVGHVDHDGERAVVAGAESLADQVVGLLVGVAGGVGAVADVPGLDGRRCTRPGMRR